MEHKPDAETLDQFRHEQEIRETWQARALAHTHHQHIGVVLLSVLAHNYDDAMPVLLRVVFPGFRSIDTPFVCSAARVAKTGAVVADVVWDGGLIVKNMVLFKSLNALKNAFRRLADKMRLDDADRIAMFAAVRKWVVADTRLDPTMDPADPDAKRLTVN